MRREGSTTRRRLAFFANRARGKIGALLMGLAAFSLVIPWPVWLCSWLAGFLISALLWILSVASCSLGWMALFMAACALLVWDLLVRRKKGAAVWLSVGVAIALANILGGFGMAPSPDLAFARGLLANVEIRTDLDAVRTWVASVDPNDCVTEEWPWRNLTREDRPEVLKHVAEHIRLQLDGEDRPSVRLEWDQSKAGKFGLVIGHKDMKTPPSEPGMYGERRTELRPGLYFWYEEG